MNRRVGLTFLRSLIALVLLGLTACASASVAPPTSGPTEVTPTVEASPAPTAAAPTVEATPAPTAAAPTVVPTEAPTTQPSTVPATALLPNPLIFIGETEQLVRLEADGTTITPITFEDQPVLDFDLAANGAIFYVVGDSLDDTRLFVLDGAGRRELLAGAISAPRAASDGSRVVYRLDDPDLGLIIGQEESPPGVWGSAAAGGRPGLVLPDLPPTPDDSEPAWSYTPVDFSPDGTTLAVFGFDQDGPAIPGGQLVLLGNTDADPVFGLSCCEQERWSVDGASLAVAGGGPGPDIRYGLFSIDAADGSETIYLESDENTTPFVLAPRRLADGEMYAFVELVPSADVTWEYPFLPAMSIVAPDGTVTALREADLLPVDVLWAEDGSGAVTAELQPELDSPRYPPPGPLAWLPVGGPAKQLDLIGRLPHWAATDWFPAACEAFNPILYQPDNLRTFSDAARDIQRRLAAAGFDPGVADGFYGNQTRSAVEALQAQNGLPVSGDVDCATWQALVQARP